MADPIRPDPCSSTYVLPLDSDWARTERAEEAAPTTLDHVGAVALEVPLPVGTAVDEARGMGEQALETAARRIESDRRGTVRGSALCPAMG